MFPKFSLQWLMDFGQSSQDLFQLLIGQQYPKLLA